MCTTVTCTCTERKAWSGKTPKLSDGSSYSIWDQPCFVVDRRSKRLEARLERRCSVLCRRPSRWCHDGAVERHEDDCAACARRGGRPFSRHGGGGADTLQARSAGAQKVGALVAEVSEPGCAREQRVCRRGDRRGGVCKLIWLRILQYVAFEFPLSVKLTRCVNDCTDSGACVPTARRPASPVRGNNVE